MLRCGIRGAASRENRGGIFSRSEVSFERCEIDTVAFQDLVDSPETNTRGLN
jgi:hypothetical protein